MRSGFVGTIVLAGGLLVGCAGPRELNAEPDRVRAEPQEDVRFPTETNAAATAEPAVGVVLPDGLSARQRINLLNARKMRDLPDAVRRAFNAQFPRGAITGIDYLDTGAGLIIYEINFTQNREAYDVLYKPDGTPLTRTPLEDAPAPQG